MATFRGYHPGFFDKDRPKNFEFETTEDLLSQLGDTVTKDPVISRISILRDRDDLPGTPVEDTIMIEMISGSYFVAGFISTPNTVDLPEFIQRRHCHE